MVLNDESLLQLWEQNQRAHPVRRALLALAAASPELGWEGCARASVGARDAGLLNLHECLFGDELRTTAACPNCGERLESEFSTHDIRSRERMLEPGALRLSAEDFEIEYRLPTSDDLLEISAGDCDTVDAASQLLNRCVTQTQCRGRTVDPATLPDAVVERIAADMARNDPDADVRIALECPTCRNAWQLRFDIVSYFWSELDDWAQRILVDVHALASAYGWSERAILALSPARRRIYLDMVGA